jgi:hypothetical protein
MQVLANTQDPVVAAHMAGEGILDRGIFEGESEDLTRDITHMSELLFA